MVRLTDHPDVTLDVYPGRKTQQLTQSSGMEQTLYRVSLRAFKPGSQVFPRRSKGVLDYDSGACCFKEVKTTASVLIFFFCL